MISIRQRIESGLEFLQIAKVQNFKNVSHEKIEELIKDKLEYKQAITTTEECKLYSCYKFQLHELCSFKLPFRIIGILKKCLKQNQKFPESLSDKICIEKQFVSKLDRSEALSKLKQDLIAMSLSHSEALKVVESIHWVHGTNSAILPMLSYNNYTMLSTGELLNKGIAPMCGELSQGGLFTSGVSQQWISCETIRNLSRCWNYAATISNSFDPSKFEDAERFFTESLKRLKNITPFDSLWDIHVISLLQLKQWSPKVFELLTNKYQNAIERLIFEAMKITFYRECEILEAIQYPDMKLKQAIYDEQIRKEVEKKCPTLNTNWYKQEKNDNGYYVGEIVDMDYSDSYFIHGGGDSIFSRCPGWKFLVTNLIRIRLCGDEAIQDLKLYSDVMTERIRLQGDEAMQDLRNHSYIMMERKWKKLQKLCGEEPKVSDLLRVVKEKIEKRIQSKQCSMEKRILRLRNVFIKDLNVKISEDEKPMINSPFPIMIASTKTKCFFLCGNSEASIISAKWGDEIDVVFVKPENISAMTNWLEKQGLADKVQVHDQSMISSLSTFPLYHTASDVIGENLAISSCDYKIVRQHIQGLLPFYKKKGYEHHGVAHVIRAAYFASIITEMYLAKGHVLATHPRNLPIAGFLHDAGRESDFGKDLWDEQSGKICADFATDQLKLLSQEVEILSKSISEKDRDPSISLEQKIIHDADCIEIIRCLLDSPDAFEWERLWMFKDQFPKPMLDLFIHEARSLIVFTEKPAIKKFLQSSPDPLRCLLQIIEFAKSFSFLMANSRGAWGAFCSESDYLLTPEVEKAINEHFSHIC